MGPRWLRIGVFLALLSVGAADKPPAAPATARSSATSTKKPGGAAQENTATRPALRRQGALKHVLKDAIDPEEVAVTIEEADEMPQAKTEEKGGGLISQVFTLGLFLLIRIGLGLWKAFRQRSAGADGAADPFAGFNAMLAKTPLGPVLESVGSLVANFKKFASSPNAAPVMMGLLILSMKLVNRVDTRMEKDAEDASTVSAQAEATSASEDTDAEVVDVESEEVDGEDDDDEFVEQ